MAEKLETAKSISYPGFCYLSSFFNPNTGSSPVLANFLSLIAQHHKGWGSSVVSTCPAFTKLWVSSPALPKNKEKSTTD
jgi:hypothetical protein